MRIRIFFVLLLVLTTSVCFAQSSKKKKKKETTDQPNSIDPNVPSKDYAPKKSRKSSSGPTFESQQEYQDRMEALAKTKRKNEKMMEDPQYSDPSYFGHKRPPKRHKPSKMKYCKVCGIRH